jgi:hypothetical protein
MAATLEQQIEGEAQRLYQQRAFSEPTTQAWKDWADLTDEEREPYRRTARNLLTGSPEPVDTQALAAEAEHGYDPASVRPVAVVEQRHLERAAEVVVALSDTYGLDELRDRIASALARAEEIGREQMRGGIRVLRLIEYVYPTVKAMVEDTKRWQIQGDRQYGRTHIRSMALPPEVLG